MLDNLSLKYKYFLIILITSFYQIFRFMLVIWIVNHYGTKTIVDQFFLSLVLILSLSGIFIGIIQTGYFPVKDSLKNDKDNFDIFFIILISLFSFFFTVIIIFLVPIIIPLSIPESSIISQEELINIIIIIIPIIFLLTVSESVIFILTNRGRVFIGHISYLLSSLTTLGYLLIINGDILEKLIYSHIFGYFCQLTICLIFLKPILCRFKKNSFLKKKNWINFFKIFKISIPILPGLIISNIILVLPNFWLAGYKEGAITSFNFAYRIYSGLLQTFIISGSNLFLTNFSKLISQKNLTLLKKTLILSFWISIIIGLCTTFVTLFFGNDLITLVSSQVFTLDSIGRVQTHLLILVTSLGFAIQGNFFAKLFQADSQGLLMSKISFINLLCMIASYELLKEYFDEYSISISILFGLVVTSILSFFKIYDKHISQKN